jgi:hypothetical protein
MMLPLRRTFTRVQDCPHVVGRTLAEQGAEVLRCSGFTMLEGTRDRPELPRTQILT